MLMQSIRSNRDFLVGDAAGPNFKAFAKIVKDEKDNTKLALSTLVGGRKANL